mgnify:CR=1 FL=1
MRMLIYRHICLDGSAECDDNALLKSTRIHDAVDGLLDHFSYFFRRVTGFSLWAMQMAWARRMLSGESFALIAPTGVGKSTILQAYSLYRALEGERVLYVVPTRSLVQQVTERLGTMSRGLKVEVRNGLDMSGPGVNVLTHMLLFKNREALRSVSLGAVIVDDFDALLKRSSLLDFVLFALGFTPEDIEAARTLIKLRQSALALRHWDSDRYKEASKAVEDLERRLIESVGGRRIGQLLIASATGRGRRERVKVLRELLRFEIGGIVDYLRNIREFSAPLGSTDLVGLIRMLGRGTLVFVSKGLGRVYVEKLAEQMESEGLRVSAAHTTKAIERLRRGEVDVLIGVATYYGVLTRGIDEPTLIKSSVFVGVPKFSVPLDVYLSRVTNIITAFKALVGNPAGDPKYAGLYGALSRLRPSGARLVDLCLRGVLQPSNSQVERLVSYAMELRDYVKEEIESRLSSVSLVHLGNSVAQRSGSGGTIVEIPDVYTYIQGSGRTSRLLGGRMTLGVSVLLYENDHIYELFLRKLRGLFETNFRELDPDELARSLSEALESRSNGGSGDDVVSRIVPTLIVVESPTKARTIAKIFGGGGRRYVSGLVAYETVIPLGKEYYVATIVPSLGHIFDLAVDAGKYGVRVSKDGGVEPVYTSLKRCRECGHQFTDESDSCPRCGSLRVYDSTRTVNIVRRLARESSLVIIATDADEEGEKIAYDIYVALRPYNPNIRRAEFREITRFGVLSGLSSLRDVDVRLVKSQVVRRVDDRLVGFGLSNALKELLGTPNAGGGRVQTPVLTWVVDRYREYLQSRGYVVLVELPYGDLTLRLYAGSREEAETLSKALQEGIEVNPLLEETETLGPKPPYTTDTALEELCKFLRLTPNDAMRVLQELYELGFITYHRTPSTRVSGHGIEIARAYLRSAGLEYLFSPRGWGEGGAHEAIRPTKPIEDIEAESIQLGTPLTRRHYEAYRLIFRRFVASQMVQSRVLFRWYSFASGGRELARLRLPVRVLEEGFTRVMPVKLYELPERSSTVYPRAVRVFRGSRVSLPTTFEVIRRMREEGLGRPSTYAKAIENNRKHGYVVISKRRQFLIPTKRGFAALEAVRKVYPQLTTPLYTAKLMRLMEKVEVEIPYDLAILIPLSALIDIEIGKARGWYSAEAGLPSHAGESIEGAGVDLGSENSRIRMEGMCTG